MAGSLHSPSVVHPCGGIRAERAVVVQYATLRTSRCAYTARGQSHLKFNVCESELNELREEGAITARRCCNQDGFVGFSGQIGRGLPRGPSRKEGGAPLFANLGTIASDGALRE